VPRPTVLLPPWETKPKPGACNTERAADGQAADLRLRSLFSGAGSGDLFFHQTQAPADGRGYAHAHIACMSRLRFLVLMIEALRPGAFEWVLFESFDDAPGFEPFARSDLSFPTYESAWEAGCAALQSRMEEPKLDLLDDED